MSGLRRAGSWVGDGLLVFVLAAALIWPLFRLDYSDKWASIESTFIADARYLRDHWPHPGWHPLWYMGTRFDYIYPPALRYGTAVQMKLMPGVSPAKAYHRYVGLLYCLGIAGVYVLARTGGRSRLFAVIAALAVATIAPSFLMIGEIRQDARASWSEPQRLGVLVRYGEGPHISALSLLGFALAFAIQALRRGTAGWVVAAAAGCALVVSNNFYGATALALLFPVLLWSWWVTHQEWWMFPRAALIIGLSYGLTAFWLVPSYVTVTLDNLRFVSERGNRWSLWVTLVLAIVYLKLTERWAKGRPERAYSVFLIGAVALLTLNVIGNYYAKFRIIGEPFRMVPELDLVLLLAACEILRRMWDGTRWRLPRRVVAAVLVLLSFYSVRKYIDGGRNIFVGGGRAEERLEYRITEWMAKNMPGARTYTNGTVRFWYNAWFDLAQLGGGSEQGLLNPVTQTATWNLGASEEPQRGILWMLATGVDAAIIHDKESEEHYHDVVNPKKFDGVLPVVYDDGKGNRIYRVPRRYPGLARVVDRRALEALPVLADDPPDEQLRLLVDVLEKGPEAPIETHWEGSDRLRIRTRVGAGETVFVQVTYDKAWRAESGGKRLAVTKSQLHFLRVDAPPGEQEIDLVFETPAENLVGRGVFAGTVLVAAWMLARRRRVL